MKSGKNLVSFFCGAAAVGVVLLAAVPALAAGGFFSAGKTGVSLFGRTRIAPGETFAAASGERVPAVVTYTDAAGGQTNYIAARKLAELFDVAGVAWDGETGCVAFAPDASGTGVTIIQDGKVVKRTGDGNGITITIGDETSLEDRLPDTPVLGTTAGPFTEIDPSAADTARRAVYASDGMTVRSENGLNHQLLSCSPGDTAVFEITNNGSTAQQMNVCRRQAVSYGQTQWFSTVKIEPGRTLTRAFTLREDAGELERQLEWTVDGGGEDGVTDITVTVRRYQHD